jgi:uncharacterized iron-regulated membrane protein
MRRDIIRVSKTVHTWTGIVGGLALFIAFYAGAITMFKDSLGQWVEPPTAVVQGVPLDRAVSLIEQTLAAHPDARRQFTLKLAPVNGDPARTSASLAWQPPGQPQRTTATLDAAGKLLVHASRRFLNAQFLPGEGNGNVWSAITSAVFALHFGSYGGEPVRWGYFFLGLAGAFLFHSGNLQWIESRRKAERRDGLAVICI